MRMDFRKLEIFAAVADNRSFSRAAQQLYMAQPAVSIAVRKLEESLGLQLLDRSGRDVMLTIEGEEVLRRARRILQESAELLATSSSMRDLIQGELNIACPSMLATYYLPDLLSAFLNEHSGLSAAVTQAGTERVETLLLEDRVEIGVTHREQQSNDLDLIPLVQEKMVLCVAANHPWAGRKSIAIEDLQDQPMVLYESGYFIRSKLDALCRETGTTLNLRLQTNFLPLLMRMVKQGIGMTVGLQMLAQQEPGIAGIPILGDTSVDMALAKRKGRAISRANQAFLDWVAITL